MDTFVLEGVTKVCAHCATDKTLDAFYKHPTAKYGVGSVCRDCHKAYYAKRAKTPKRCDSKSQVCSRCKVEKPLTDFYKDSTSKNGYHKRCRVCAKQHMKEWRQSYKSQPDRPVVESKRCPGCQQVLPPDCFNRDKGTRTGLQVVCRQCGFNRRETERIDALTHYSGGQPRCACCGETHVAFLSFDHINGGGRQHRIELRESGQSDCMFKWLKKNNYPEGFQVLCHNCNQAKGYYGYCPHQKEKECQTAHS